MPGFRAAQSSRRKLRVDPVSPQAFAATPATVTFVEEIPPSWRSSRAIEGTARYPDAKLVDSSSSARVICAGVPPFVREAPEDMLSRKPAFVPPPPSQSASPGAPRSVARLQTSAASSPPIERTWPGVPKACVRSSAPWSVMVPVTTAPSTIACRPLRISAAPALVERTSSSDALASLSPWPALVSAFVPAFVLPTFTPPLMEQAPRAAKVETMRAWCREKNRMFIAYRNLACGC